MTAIYRVRVDLDGAAPPIWRRLDLRADLPLDMVHLVVQAAFGWENRHLYRFATGGGPFDDGSQRISVMRTSPRAKTTAHRHRRHRWTPSCTSPVTGSRTCTTTATSGN